MSLSFVSVFKTLINAYGELNIEKGYQLNNILRKQQRFEESNTDFVINDDPPSSTPVKRAKLEYDRKSDEEYQESQSDEEEYRAIIEDDHASEGDEGEVVHNETLGVSGVSRPEPTTTDAPYKQVEEEMLHNIISPVNLNNI